MKKVIVLNYVVMLNLLQNAYSADFSVEENHTVQPSIDSVSQKANADDNNTHYLQHPYGYPITVLSFTSDFNVSVDYENLRKLFMHPVVENRKAVTVSIIGAFRKGKSFILNYFLRYLYSKFKSVNNMTANPTKSSWMGKPSDPLTGFSWKSGTERHTTGIVFWSDVFLYDAPNGEKYAIYLIDTQGLFDTKTPLQENIKIFGLGTLISSLQIFNLNDVIQEDQLQYLQMATDYARFAVAENKAKGFKGTRTFQNLLFLLRDWVNVDEYQYGLEEGHLYLMDVLQTDENQKPALREVRLYIQSSFEKVDCFLMPHPGEKVANNKKYDGRFSEMYVDFRNELSKLVTWLFSAKNLKAKKIFNEELTSKKLYHYMRSYCEVFEMDAPEVESIYSATVNSHLKSLVDSYLTEFQTEMSRNVNVNSAESIAGLDDSYNSLKDRISEKFRVTRKMGNSQQEEKYFNILRTKIDEFYQDFKKFAVNTHNTFVESIARAEQEMKLFEEQLNDIMQSNKTQLAEDIQKLEQEIQIKQQDFAQEKDKLEALRDEMLKNIINNHSLSLEEINSSKSDIQEAYKLKIKESEIEQENLAAIYQQKLLEKKDEAALIEQAVIEQEKKMQDELKKQEEIANRQWERQQALKIEELKFQQNLELSRLTHEREMFALQVEADKQKQMFEKEMEVTRSKNQEKIIDYQLKLEEIKEKTNSAQRIIESQHMNQQKEMQMKMMQVHSENQRQVLLAKQQIDHKRNEQLIGATVKLLPLIITGRENVPELIQETLRSARSKLIDSASSLLSQNAQIDH